MVEAKIVSTKVMLGFRKAWCLLVSLKSAKYQELGF